MVPEIRQFTALCGCSVASELQARAWEAWPGSFSGAGGGWAAGEADLVSQGFGSLSGLPENPLQVQFYSSLSLQVPGGSSPLVGTVPKQCRQSNAKSPAGCRLSPALLQGPALTVTQP